MILKLLSGEKTQTRRIIKPQPTQSGATLWWKNLAYDLNKRPNWMEKRRCPYGIVGDRLWVRETWRQLEKQCAVLGEIREPGSYSYKAEYKSDSWQLYKWKPSIFMPREACRIILEITGVKVERLEDCSAEDAIAEGFSSFSEFLEYFYKLNPEYINLSPWVWCIAFKRIDATTDRD